VAQAPTKPEAPQNPSNTGDKKSLALATFLQLERQVRHANSTEKFRFIVVNETHRLIRYDQAVLWKTLPGNNPGIEAISGVSMISQEAPYIHWLENILTSQLSGNSAGQCHVVSRTDVTESAQKDWNEWIGSDALWCPLLTAQGTLYGGLWLTRSGGEWHSSEQALLARIADAYAHAWQALDKQSSKSPWLPRINLKSGRRRVALLTALLLVLFLPVRQSALAPAEIVPLDPVIVTSPLDGVISDIHVQPNSSVRKGDLLFSLDDTTIRNKHQVAIKSAIVAQAEYLRAAQKAFSDESSKSELAMLRAQVEVKDAEVHYTSELLEKVDVHATRDGIAIFTAANDWIGKPVVVGEKVITLADPDQTEIQLWLPVDDAINLEAGTEVKLFLNIDPIHPLAGTLRQTSYEPQVTPEGNLAFQLKAGFDHIDKLPRVGLKGTGKIYGKRVLLIDYLLRRPISALRRFTGL
jgi:multidrug resistance efflux pump